MKRRVALMQVKDRVMVVVVMEVKREKRRMSRMPIMKCLIELAGQQMNLNEPVSSSRS